MAKIKSYTIEMRPMGYGQNAYEIHTRVNGDVMSICKVVVDWAPHEAEMEVLHRMGMEIIRGLREKEEHKDCCDCCNKKKSKCQKY